jgi:hypothetical protein
MQDDIAFAPPAETLTTDERLAELAAILASAIARTNPRETNENSPLSEMVYHVESKVILH